jgi:hypothetical protein
MPSTYSPLKFELIAVGEQDGVWGVTTNTNLGTATEQAITGSEDVLCVLEAKDFHWFSYFPDMPEDGRTRMGTSRDENAPPIHLLRNGQGGIQAFFISAWAPPIEFYNRLVEKFGDIRIEYEYHEWSMGFAGFCVAGVAESREPTHFSYECADDINLMSRNPGAGSGF